MVTVHPEAAVNLGIQTGESVWVETRYGRITLTVKVSDKVHPKVVYSEHGWYFPEEPETTLFDCMRSNYNAVTSNERLGQAFGTPNLRALPCRLSRI
jgi:anaerobic selenocysteine-containing dehydrogenase